MQKLFIFPRKIITSLYEKVHDLGKWIVIIDCSLGALALIMIFYSAINGAKWITVIAITASFAVARTTSAFCLVSMNKIVAHDYGQWSQLIPTAMSYVIGGINFFPARATAFALGHFKSIPNGYAVGIAMWVALYTALAMCLLAAILVLSKLVKSILDIRRIEKELENAGP